MIVLFRFVTSLFSFVVHRPTCVSTTMAQVFNQAMKDYAANEFASAAEGLESFISETCLLVGPKVKQAQSQAKHQLLRCYVHLGESSNGHDMAVELLELYLPAKTVKRILALALPELCKQMSDMQPKLITRWKGNHGVFCDQIAHVCEQRLLLGVDSFWLCVFCAFRLQLEATTTTIVAAMLTSDLPLSSMLQADLHWIGCQLNTTPATAQRHLLHSLSESLQMQDQTRVARCLALPACNPDLALAQDATGELDPNTAMKVMCALAQAWLRCHQPAMAAQLKAFERYAKHWRLEPGVLTTMTQAVALLRIKACR